MQQKDYSFDYVRTIATFIIISGHYNLYCCGNNGIGRLLGGGGFFLFFFLSALLFGSKWCRKNKQPFDGVVFMKQRIKRIGSSLWPFLIASLAVFYLLDIDFSIVNAFLNFVFLGYIGKLPGNGHLWFLTILMVCYAEFLLLSRIKISNSVLLLVVLLGLVMYLISEIIGIPGHSFLTIGISALIFEKADYLLSLIRSIPKYLFLILLSLTTIIMLLLFDNSMFDNHRLFAYPLMAFCGIVWLITMVGLFPNKKSLVISFLSQISFEMYLVHHTFCAGPAFRVSQIGGPSLLQFSCLVLISIIAAYLLHLLSNFIVKALERR